jgi:hypothetical protein
LKKDKKTGIFPLTVDVEVIAIKGDKVVKKVMTYGKALEIPKAKGWTYRFYEIGFSQFKT